MSFYFISCLYYLALLPPSPYETPTAEVLRPVSTLLYFFLLLFGLNKAVVVLAVEIVFIAGLSCLQQVEGSERVEPSK